MKLLIAFLLAFFSTSAYNQNLVPNPSFEDYVTPPCSWLGTQSDLAAAVNDWYILSGSPDIFNTLVPTSCFANCFSTDYYAVGHQQPHSGDFMAGIITYGAGMGASSQYRESYEIQLTSPLIVGQQYYVEMYVSLGDYSTYASNNLSFYFSVPQVIFDISNTGPLYFTPQVTETSIVADTNNWVKVSGTFTADTPAEYLLIANFTDDSLTDAFHINPTPWGDAYYFIDDILVKETCLSVGNNKTICANDSTVITASSDSFNGWALASNPATIISTDSSFMVAPTSTTTYLALSDCDTFSVTVYVQSAPPDLFLGNDTTICEGTTLVLQATDANGSYEWQDGSTNPSFDATTAGTYSLHETNQCGTSYSEIHLDVSPLPDMHFGEVAWFCEGDSVILTEAEPTLQTFYIDENGNFISTTVIKSPGFYYLTAHNDCGYISNMVSFEMVTCPDNPEVEVDIELPNIVTPNGDQINDLLIPVHLKGIATMKTTLFNRWGETVYETTNLSIEWDGSSYSEGVYFWKIEYTDFQSKTNEKHGFFQLLK